MTKKLLLKTRSEPAYYTLVGISCHLMDYRFLHFLNSELGVNFRKEDDLKIHIPNIDQPVAFSFYSYTDEDQRNFYYLVSNFSQDFILVPEFRHIDYMLMIEGDFKKKKKDSLLSIIRSIPKVQAALEIKIANIKNAELFLTDIEMHISDIHQEIKSNRQNTFSNLKGGKNHV
jgi:hypothetical protein